MFLGLLRSVVDWIDPGPEPTVGQALLGVVKTIVACAVLPPLAILAGVEELIKAVAGLP